ncbi:MAG: FeoB small GTPase domain-containing protein, partial [Candidatus Eisenbacteria bacterium]
MKPARPLRRVAIIGNPNTGKTSVFNALTGLTQKVGNYPGVTVEKKTGLLTPEIELIDLPGMYSLAAHSPDELLATRVLLGDYDGEPQPDLVLVIADAGNLQRNLYLATQVIEVGLPAILVLNMIDTAERHGITVNTRALSRLLGVPVVPTVAHRRLGVAELRLAILSTVGSSPPEPLWTLPEPIARERTDLETRFGATGFILTRALIDEGGPAERLLEARWNGDLRTALADARARIRSSGRSPAALEAEARHRWIADALETTVRREKSRRSLTERVDNVLAHRILGFPIFML